MEPTCWPPDVSNKRAPGERYDDPRVFTTVARTADSPSASACAQRSSISCSSFIARTGLLTSLAACGCVPQWHGERQFRARERSKRAPAGNVHSINVVFPVSKMHRVLCGHLITSQPDQAFASRLPSVSQIPKGKEDEVTLARA